ncbi:cytochrome c [Hydrogenophaga sp.]|uniref:c-type cytochrome n=1 Tax=Hydrogenophaga sp. TaxID=1904254 RepID=UPI0019C13C4D|nr:cytochrome c [Hydrogenophaga sp.]MBD3892735.1 cytochrome c [Hydrogenophaga sp.]
MKIFSSLALAGALAALAAPAMAQFQKPEDAVKYRQAAFTVMGAHFGRLGAMANGRVPFDARVAAENAAVVESLSKLPWAAFGTGTQMAPSRSLPHVWAEQARFRAGAERMQVEVVKLSAAANSGDLQALRAAFGPAAQSCKACHDDFRRD